MTMASPPPSEEERRLLREYRLTTVPSRRSSCSPATSNASSSTNNLSEQQLQQPQIITATSLRATVITSQTEQGVGTNNSNQVHLHNGHHNHNHHHHHHHHKHHGGHHHHSHSNHKRHKSTTPTHELTADELDRMLELVSKLGILKLGTNGNKVDAIRNGRVMNEENTGDPDDQSGKKEVHNMINGSNKSVSDKIVLARSCLNSSISTNCKPHIFEKVDYINKISIRRKALKKLKKAQSKSRVTSPSNTGL